MSKNKNKIERYNIIAMVDSRYGLSVKGVMPMKSPQWGSYFNQITKHNSVKNNIIMGRKAYEDIILKTEHKVLQNRFNYVISNTLIQNEHDDIIIHKTLIDTLCTIANKRKIENFQSKTWIIGGKRVIAEALEFYKAYCNEIYLFKLNHEIYCDLYFPIDLLQDNGVCFTPVNENVTMEAGKIVKYILREKVKPQECQYLDLLKNICDRSVKSVSNESCCYSTNSSILEFDVSTEIPILTTRTINYSDIRSKLVEDFSNNYFDTDDIGFRLRCNGQKFGSKGEYELNDSIDKFLTDFSKTTRLSTLCLSNTNTENFIPFYMNFSISDSGGRLNCLINYNEIDVCTVLPYHLIYFTMLQHVCAHILDIRPSKLTIVMARPFVLNDYIDFIDEQSKFDPKSAPKCKITNLNLKDMNFLKSSDITISRYESWPNARNKKKYEKLLIHDYPKH